MSVAALTKYEDVFKRGGGAIHDRPARIAHGWFPTATGVTVIDVWVDEAAFAAFGAVIGPATEQAGLLAPPAIYPVHGFLGPDGVRHP